MMPEQAAWVREHAWTDRMRRAPVWQPGTNVPTYDKAKALSRCECMVGTCGHCTAGQHESCPSRPGARRDAPRSECWLAGVPVWLADRICRRLCPCSCAPMTEREAAWVREHAWTRGMRKCFGGNPGHYLKCDCQGGLTSWCRHGQCDRCHRATPLPGWEALICDRTGLTPLRFGEPFEHPTRASATGPRRERLAMVWLADRVCRWVCPCPHHTAPAAPAPKPAGPLRYELVPLPGFELLGSDR